MHSLRFRSLVYFAFALGVVALPAAEKPATSKRGKAEKDSPPILMSRTGGGSAWADVNELRAAAEQGDPKARAQYGEMLLRGDPAHQVAQDRAGALAMLEEAARAGEASAAFRIGMLLDEGDGVVQDRARALAYFKAAAVGGAAEAFHNIGVAHANGRGVKPDFAEALAWLTLAGNRGADRSAEQAVRGRLQKTGRTQMLARAEKRAQEIESELAGKKVAELLPPPTPFQSARSAPSAKAN